MTTTTTRGPNWRAPFALTTMVAATSFILAGCSDGDGDGDEHELGKAVDIDFYSDAGTEPLGRGTIAVTDVREGSTAELEDAGFSLDPDEKAAAAVYVDVTFANQSDAAVPLHSPGAEDPDGNLISALTVIDLGGGTEFTPCPGVPEEVTAGEESQGCAIVLVPAGREIERVYYHPGGSDDFIYWKTE